MPEACKLVEKDGLQYLVFPALEGGGKVINAFTTRLGGVSSPPYDTLNLGSTTLDNIEKVWENRNRASRVLGIPLNELAELVHSDEIIEAGSVEESFPLIADGIITKVKGIALTFYYADCVPVFLVDPVNEAVGIVHAGWRGTLKEISEKAVKKMADAFGSKPEEILAGIGPSIGPCCFEVGRDVAGEFASWKASVKQRDNRWFVDLWEINSSQILKAGIKPENLYKSNLCTSCESRLFFSYRKAGGNTGRMAGIIALKGK